MYYSRIPDNFPYEYYSVRFSTFSGSHFAQRYLRHRS